MKPTLMGVCLALAGWVGSGLPGQYAGRTAVAFSPPVLLDQSGVGMRGALVRNEHRWVITAQFHLPRGEWGVTYAYRCSGRGDFWMAVAQTEIDGINPGTVVFKRKPQGRGYKMETGKVLPQVLDPTSNSPGITTDLQTLQIESRCRWHVRVVDGPAAIVAHHVPAIPSPGDAR